MTREEALCFAEHLKRNDTIDMNLIPDFCDAAIEALSREPRRKGKWIKSNIPEEDYTCSECGGACWYYDYERRVAKSNYCPNCGADMREE